MIKREEGSFFGDEKEYTVVEAVVRGLSSGEAAGNERKYGGRVLARDPVGLEHADGPAGGGSLVEDLGCQTARRGVHGAGALLRRLNFHRTIPPDVVPTVPG